MIGSFLTFSVPASRKQFCCS